MSETPPALSTAIASRLALPSRDEDVGDVGKIDRLSHRSLDRLYLEIIQFDGV